MTDSFADLWQSSAPVAKPQTLSSLNSNSNSNPGFNARGSSSSPAQSQTQPQRKTPDVFALLASKSTSNSSSSSNAYRPQPSAHSISRTTTASPASLSSTPSYLTSHSQPASRPSSTPAASNSAARSKDAFGDLFSSAAGTNTFASTSSMSLAARARMEQEQRQRQQGSSTAAMSAAQSELDAWAGLDALGGGAAPSISTVTPSRSTSNKTPATHVDDTDDWGLGDFGSAPAPAPAPVSRSTSKASATSASRQHDVIIDEIDDDWGLPALSNQGSSATTKPVSTSISAAQDEDDILGMLSRPVEDLRAAKASHSSSPSPPIASRRPQLPPSSTTTTASAPSRDPPPHILGQIVEMGFSVTQARSALMSASSSANSEEWNVQAALEMLLSEGQSGGPSPAAASRAGTPQGLPQQPPQHASQQAPGGRAPPKGRRERDMERQERQERLARLEREIAASASGPAPSTSRFDTSAPSVVVPAELAQQAERVLEMGKEMGRGVFGKASAFWREGKERVGKALEERNGGVLEGRGGQGVGKGRGGAKGVPKWMQEQPEIERADEIHEGGERLHRMGGYADGEAHDDHHGGWDDEVRPSRAREEVRRQENRKADEAEVDLFNVDDEKDATRQVKQQEEVDLFSMPVPSRPAAESSAASRLSASRGASSSSHQDRSASATSSRPRPSPSSTSVPRRQRTLITASSTAISQASTHRTAGTASFKLGQYADAAAAYSRALDGLPDGHLLRIPLLTNRALALMRTGECKGAERDCAEAVRIVVGLPANSGASDSFDTATARPNSEEEAVVDAWSPAPEPADLIEAGRAKANDAGWLDAQRCEGVGVDLVDGYVKARRRRAEALEMQEKWRAAVKDWEALANAGWIPEKTRGEARSGVGRCKRMLGDDTGGSSSAGATASRSTSSAAAPKPKPRAPPKPTVLKASAASTPTGAALKALQTSTAQAEAEDTLRHTLKDSVDARLTAWRGGKETNIRALLASLDTVLWPEILAGGVQVSGLGALITPAQVKKGYVKAIARVHPDKLSPSNSTVEQRMLANGVFGTLNEAWIAFQAGTK